MRLVPPHKASKSLDLINENARDRACPFRRARGEMRLKPLRIIRIAGHIVAVGQAFTEQHMQSPRRRRRRLYRGAAQCRDRPASPCRCGRCRRPRSSPALLAGAHGVGHHIDLGRDGIGAPDHHAIGLRHLTRVGPAQCPCPGQKTGPGHVGAEGVVLPRIALYRRKRWMPSRCTRPIVPA